MIEFESKGSFKNTESFLNRIKGNSIFSTLDHYGQLGVQVLSDATPVDTSETQHSWYYEIERKPGQYSISWKNRNIVDGVSVVILIQYGHGTGTGGYVQGRDFINPVIKPIFDQIANEVWKAVTK